MHQQTEQMVVVDLLTTLRRERFHPHACWQFLQRSIRLSCQTAQANPSLKTSWQCVTGFIVLLALLPGLVVCVVWQQSDLFWHLGLNRSLLGRVLPTIGIANTLTELRGLGAAYLLGRLAGGLTTSSAVALVVFLCGTATDILDGYIARRLRASWARLPMPKQMFACISRSRSSCSRMACCHSGLGLSWCSVSLAA